MIRFSDDKPAAPNAAKPAPAKTAPRTAAQSTAEPVAESAAEPRTAFDVNGKLMSVPGLWTESELAPFLKALSTAKLNVKAVGKTKVGRHLQTTFADPAAYTAELETFAHAVRA